MGVQLINFSVRDQLGLVYACFKHQIKPFVLPDGKLIYNGYTDYYDSEQVTFSSPRARSKFRFDSEKL